MFVTGFVSALWLNPKLLFRDQVAPTHPAYFVPALCSQEQHQREWPEGVTHLCRSMNYI